VEVRRVAVREKVVGVVGVVGVEGVTVVLIPRI